MRGTWYERALALGRHLGTSTVHPMRSEGFVPVLIIVSLLTFFGPVILDGLFSSRPPAPPPAPEVTLAPRAVPARPSVVIYVVKPGENLWAIARKFAVDVATLTEANALPTPDRLQVGQRLTVPSPQAIVEPTLATIAERLRDGTVRQIRPALAVIHTVTVGESLASIARDYGVDAETLRAANPLARHPLRAGDQLRVPPGKGVFHVVKEGETVEGLAERYRVDADAIMEANWLTEEGPLWVGEELFIPGGRRPTAPSSSLGFIWPLRGQITDHFGWRAHPLSGVEGFHHGIDIAAPLGRAFVAVQEGRVVFSGWRQDYGRTLVIDHGGETLSLYAHNSANLVSVGQWVRQGEVIGRVGESGSATGPHLHFEVHRGKKAINPLLALRR